MATDAAAAADTATERPRPSAALPWEARLLLTFVLLALYYFGHRLKLPLVNPEAVALLAPRFIMLRTVSRFSLLGLGFAALFSGFILVELFSVATSPGRRLRQSGAAGRARLNRAALVTSLLLAALQAAPRPNVRTYRQVAARVVWFLYSGGTTKTEDPSVRTERTRSKNEGR